ncbi:tyrosine-type recombinase/integrase [Pseudoalteromonas sp. B137]
MLNNEKIKALKCPEDKKQFKKFDSNGLYLLVNRTGSKLWRLKYKYGGKHKVMALGKYPTIPLKDARKKADKARLLLHDGIDPMAERKLKKHQSYCEDLNFGVIAHQWLELNQAEWSEDNYKKLARWLNNDLKNLCKLQIDRITKQHLIKIVNLLVDANTKKKVPPLLSMLNRIFKYASAQNITDHNPLINFGFTQLVGKMPSVKNHAAITDSKQLGQLIYDIENNTFGNYCSREALKLLPHLFIRPNELRHLKWEYIDFENAYIRIPSFLMKARNEHIVPLTQQTSDLLRAIHQNTNYSEYVFPSEKNPCQPMSKNVLNNRLKALGYTSEQIVSHGFRGTASTILNELGENSQYIETQLAHQTGNSTSRAYNHAKFLKQRTAMMQRWSDLLDKLRDEAVTPHF